MRMADPSEVVFTRHGYSSRSFENDALTTRPLLCLGIVKYTYPNLSKPAEHSRTIDV
jgi:hypothetical protein